LEARHKKTQEGKAYPGGKVEPMILYKPILGYPENMAQIFSHTFGI
jgi:hypothetical protein